MIKQIYTDFPINESKIQISTELLKKEISKDRPIPITTRSPISIRQFLFIPHKDVIGHVVAVTNDKYQCIFDEESVKDINLSEYRLVPNLIGKFHNEDDRIVVDDIAILIEFSLRKKEKQTNDIKNS